MNKEWFYLKSTHHLGPFSVEEIEELYSTKNINEHTLVWKEGEDNWLPISKVVIFNFIFVNNLIDSTKEEIEDELPPPLPIEEIKIDDFPPPIPLDAILDPSKTESKKTYKKNKRSPFFKIAGIFGSIIFVIVIAQFIQNQKSTDVQLRLKNIMPIYIERLESTASRQSNQFLVELVLSLDGLTLLGSTNNSEEIISTIELKSIPKKILGNEEVAVKVKGKFKDHLGRFSSMILIKGTKFFPGEYAMHMIGKKTHFLNHHFPNLTTISFFKSLNKNYEYNGKVLIFSGTPREFEKRIEEYNSLTVVENLKPHQDKLESIKTLESILNGTSQNYLMELENAKHGDDINAFEKKFIKEFSPILQAIIVKATEMTKDPILNEEKSTHLAIAPYREQVLIGKQIGEMASDMITKTKSIKKLDTKNKTELVAELDKRSVSIKLQIDMNIKILEEQIKKNSNK